MDEPKRIQAELLGGLFEDEFDVPLDDFCLPGIVAHCKRWTDRDTERMQAKYPYRDGKPLSQARRAIITEVWLSSPSLVIAGEERELDDLRFRIADDSFLFAKFMGMNERRQFKLKLVQEEAEGN